jgi:hypothetical protein
MNLSTLTSLAASMALDPAQNRYTGLYTQALNLAQQQFSLDSKCLWKDWPATVAVASQANYSLPADFMWEKYVTLDGIELKPISRHELQVIKTGDRWDDDTGTPTHYIIDPDVSKSQVLLYPIPTSNDAGKDIVLTYYPLPTDLSAATDVPFNSTPLLAQFHIGIAAWAAWLLLQNEKSTPETETKKAKLLQVYKRPSIERRGHIQEHSQRAASDAGEQDLLRLRPPSCLGISSL